MISGRRKSHSSEKTLLKLQRTNVITVITDVIVVTNKQN